MWIIRINHILFCFWERWPGYIQLPVTISSVVDMCRWAYMLSWIQQLKAKLPLSCVYIIVPSSDCKSGSRNPSQWMIQSSHRARSPRVLFQNKYKTCIYLFQWKILLQMEVKWLPPKYFSILTMQYVALWINISYFKLIY